MVTQRAGASHMSPPFMVEYFYDDRRRRVVVVVCIANIYVFCKLMSHAQVNRSPPQQICKNTYPTFGTIAMHYMHGAILLLYNTIYV